MKLFSKVSQKCGRRKQMSKKASRESYDVFEKEPDSSLSPMSPSPKENVTRSKQPMVRFSEVQQYYENDVAFEDYDGCWYTRKEIQGFIKQVSKHASLILAMERQSGDPFFWTKNLLRIHEAFRQPKNLRNSMLVLRSNCTTINPSYVGLEFRTVPRIMDDHLERRQELLAEIQHWQQYENATKVDLDTRAAMIANACTKKSRVSTQFSHYIAKIHARRMC